MKKSILFFGIALIILGVSAYSFVDWDDKEIAKLETSEISEVNSNTGTSSEKKKNIFDGFIYDIGPRFAPINKEIVKNATSIDAFYDEILLKEIETLKSVTVILVIDDEQSEIRKIGYSSEFNEAQLEFLKSIDYDTNFIVRSEYLKKNVETGELEDSYSSPHLTVVPAKKATYFMGIETLKNYFKENCKEELVNVDPEKLLPAKIFFTVNKNGTIENAHQDRPSGYPEVDKKMIELINNLPGSWEPAENSKGEIVEQELVVSFGLMGC